MLTNENPHSKRFRQLLGEVRDEVDALKDEIKQLEKEKTDLKRELEEIKNKEADVFSSVKETERMTLKHQIKGLISKIDEHLADPS